jgi:hypothetical protein
MSTPPRIKVASVWRHLRQESEVRVYVGRKCRGYAESPLHNPHFGGGKEDALEGFRTHLRRELADPRSPAALEVVRLAELHAAGHPITLLCWCAPGPEGLPLDGVVICHAQIIGQVVEKVSEKLRA